MKKELSAIILNDRNGTYELNVSVPCAPDCPSSKTYTVVVTEMFLQVSLEEAGRLAEELVKRGAEITRRMES